MKLNDFNELNYFRLRLIAFSYLLMALKLFEMLLLCSYSNDLRVL